MTWEGIMTLISNGLFPIAACLGLAVFFNKVNDNYRNDIKELNAKNATEIDAVTKAITDNTMVIQRLVDMLEKER